MRVHISRMFSLAGIVALLCGLIYFAVQQDIRQSANDPQIQMAEDIATSLAQGASHTTVLPLGTIDIATSLAPFVMIIDADGKTIASSGLLDGALPSLPSGVFDVAGVQGENRMTWQPRPSVRSAIVIRAYSGTPSGFVVVGRSLREVEKREGELRIGVGIAWILSLVMVMGAAIL